eukprot:SAG11_NODE_16755_length_538_cov_1.692483_1_plen_55_part_10
MVLIFSYKHVLNLVYLPKKRVCKRWRERGSRAKRAELRLRTDAVCMLWGVIEAPA